MDIIELRFMTMKPGDVIYVTHEEDILRHKLNKMNSNSDTYRILNSIYNFYHSLLHTVAELVYSGTDIINGKKVFLFDLKDHPDAQFYYWSEIEDLVMYPENYHNSRTRIDKNKIFFNWENAVEWCRATNGPDPLNIASLEKILKKSQQKVETISQIYNDKKIDVCEKYDKIRGILLGQEETDVISN